MRFALMIEPQQGLTYDEQLAIVRRAEAAGFEAFFRSDHYQSFPGRAGGRRPTPGPSSPAWPARPSGSGWARSSRRSRSGSSGNLAKVVTTVDEMSGGRIEFGLGAGWNDVEHRQLGLPFPEITERGRHARGAARRSSTGSGASRTAGRTRASTSGSGTPSSTRSRSPCRAARRCRTARRGRGSSSAAAGSPRSMRIAARYADEFNLSSSSPDVARTKYGAARRPRARRSAGIPATIGRSTMAGVLIGRDRAELRARQQRRCWRRSATRPAARTGSTSARDALGLRDAGPGPGDGRAVRRGRQRSGSCSRTSCRAISR